jgi:hypothetical protein
MSRSPRSWPRVIHVEVFRYMCHLPGCQRRCRRRGQLYCSHAHRQRAYEIRTIERRRRAKIRHVAGSLVALLEEWDKPSPALTRSGRPS